MARFVLLQGALMREMDGGPQYTARGDIYINPEMVVGFYDHVILTQHNKILVMENLEQIQKKLMSGEG